MRSSVSMFAASAALALLATPAVRAQDAAVTVAWERYREADFEAALSVLAAAEESESLTPEDYPRALEIRALAAHALGRHDEARSTLRVLAAVDPEYGLGPEAVPVLREQLDAFRREDQRTRLSVTARDDGAEVDVRARVTRDPLALVRGVTVFAREAGDPEWAAGEGRVRVRAGGGDVEYWAEAVGPARVPLASRGSAEDPLRLSVGSEDDGGGVGWFLALGGAAVVAAGVVIAVLLVTNDGDGATVRPMPPWDP